MDKDPSNAARLTFLDAIASRLGPLGVPALSEWIPATRHKVIHSLKPLQPAECPVLLKLAADHGGVVFLRDMYVFHIAI